MKRLFLKYVSQNVLGMIGTSVYIIADTFFISVATGTNGITVLNLALPIYGIIFAIGSLIGIGTATRFTILRATGDKSANSYFMNSFLALLVIGLLFTLTAILIPGRVIALMGGDAEIVALGIPYFRCFMIFTPAFMLNYLFNAYVRNDNDPSRAMQSTLISSFMNIVLDYVFMFPLGMGMTGAALATGLSPVLGIVICLTHFKGKKNSIRLEFHGFSLKRLGRSIQLGTSAMVGELSSAVTTTVFNFLLLGLVGNIAVAAYGVIANLALVAIAIFNGVSLGAQPLISKCYGEGKIKEMKQLLRYGCITVLGFAVVIVLIGFFATNPLIALFNSEHSKEMAEIAFPALRIYFIGFLFAGLNIMITGYLSAVNQGAKSFVASILRGVIAIAGMACLLSVFFGITGVWASFAVAEVITLIACVLFLKKMK